MTPDPFAIARRLRRLYPKSAVRAIRNPVGDSGAIPVDLARYRHDPVGFATDVLGVVLTPDQQAIIKALPGRVKVNSGHGVGKTFLAAVAALWWFHTRPQSVVITTAPNERDVIDLLWTEIRLIHARAKVALPDHFIGPRAPEMFDTDEHWAKGYTARKSESFQGRHRASMLFLFDECEGIDTAYWQTTDTMFIPGGDHGWLAIGNPITTSSQSFLEDNARGPGGVAKWRLFSISALNHPNVLAGLRGEPESIPGAVTISQVEQYLVQWTRPLDAKDATLTDVQWPPGSWRWFRPGPSFKARVMGTRPTEGVDTVWGMAVWELCCEPRWNPHDCWRRKFGITLGLDAAAYGDDDTAIHVRCGPLSLHHEAHNGWGPDKAAGRLKELINEWTAWYNALACEDRPPISPLAVPVNIEFDGGYGIGVYSHHGNYRGWRGVTMGESCDDVDMNGNPLYLNTRAKAWFNAATKAAGGQMDVSRLPPEIRDRLRVQCTAPLYQLLPTGARKVEEKKEIKKRLGRSPDDADAIILAHYDPPNWAPEALFGDDYQRGF